MIPGSNSVVVVGEINRYGGEVFQPTGKNYKMLKFTIAYEKAMAGGNNRCLTKIFRVVMIGDKWAALAPQLTPGTMVMVRGDIDIDLGKEGDAQAKPSLKVFAENLTILLGSEDGGDEGVDHQDRPPARPAQAPSAPASNQPPQQNRNRGW